MWVASRGSVMVRCVTLTLAYADYVYQSGCYSINYLDHHTYVKGRSPVCGIFHFSHTYILVVCAD